VDNRVDETEEIVQLEDIYPFKEYKSSSISLVTNSILTKHLWAPGYCESNNNVLLGWIKKIDVYHRLEIWFLFLVQVEYNIFYSQM
jgi:hypothetical protein